MDMKIFFADVRDKILVFRRWVFWWVVVCFLSGVFSIFLPSLYSTTPSRYAGFGSAGVAVTDDLGAVYLNPSGIIFMKEDEAGFGINDTPVAPYSYGVDYTFYYGGGVRETFASGGRYVASLSLGNRLEASGDFAVMAGYSRIFQFGRYGDLPIGLTIGGANFIDEKNPTARRIFKPNIILGTQKDDLPEGFQAGLSVRALGDKTLAVIGGAKKFYYDEYLGVMDVDTDSKIYLGVERGVWGNLARVRGGVDTRQKALTVGAGTYMWPYAGDVYFVLPFDSSSVEKIGCSFVYRFGGYDFSQELLQKNTEKSASLERKIQKSKEELAALKKKLAETELAVKKARDFVDILDSEAAELIKKKLQMMKAQADATPPTPPPSPKSVVSPSEKTKSVEPKKTFPLRHKVSRGESLRSIAAYYYGDANKWQKIYEANTTKIERGLPKVGEELIIPAP